MDPSSSALRSPLALLQDPLYWLGLPIGLLFGASGVLHLTQPYPYVTMMRGMPFPSWHPTIVTVSGWIELGVAGACFVQPSVSVVQFTRYLTLAITPANINMWYSNAPFGDAYFTPKQHALRGVAQVVLLAWMWGLEKAYQSRDSSMRLKED
jgi:uncharacterized membrane protein